MTTADLAGRIPAWLEYLADRDAALATMKQYGYHGRTFARWAAGRTCDARLLPAYRDHLMDTGRRPRSIRQSFAALKSLCDYLRALGGLTEVPDPSCVRLPRLDPARRAVPTNADVRGLLTAADRLPGRTLAQRFRRTRAAVAVSLLAYAGLRRSELLALDTADLADDLGGELAVRVRRGKGRQTRTVPLHPDAAATLRTYLPIREEWARVHGYAADALFPVDRRRRLADRGLRDLLRELADLAGVDPNLTPHCLRHAAATRWASAPGVSVADVSGILGHSSIATTLGYLHSDPGAQRLAVTSVSYGPEPERSAPAGSRAGLSHRRRAVASPRRR